MWLYGNSLFRWWTTNNTEWRTTNGRTGDSRNGIKIIAIYFEFKFSTNYFACKARMCVHSTFTRTINASSTARDDTTDVSNLNRAKTGQRRKNSATAGNSHIKFYRRNNEMRVSNKFRYSSVHAYPLNTWIWNDKKQTKPTAAVAQPHWEDMHIQFSVCVALAGGYSLAECEFTGRNIVIIFNFRPIAFHCLHINVFSIHPSSHLAVPHSILSPVVSENVENGAPKTEQNQKK